MVELKFEAPRRNELLSLDKYDINGKDESITVRSEYPEYPVPCFKVTEGFDFKKAEEVALEWDVKVSKSIPNYIIIPDPAPQVPHEEVFQHVSYVLKEYGFSHTGDFLNTINLRPYDCRKSDRELCKGTQTANLDAAGEKAVRKKAGGGWDPTYTKRCFFPYWRSVLLARFPVKVYPAYASADPRSEPGQRGVFMSIRADKLGLRQRISPVTSNNQPRRCFITAATGAFRLLKVLK
uniref:Uncharacterized protein n=1 Tax=Avena sativa TaxID=4498 RepID=A0ACD5YHN5_AVESA